MNSSLLKNIALQAGLSQKEAIDLYDQSIIEAKHLGKEKDEQFVFSIMRTLSGLDEEDINHTIRKLNTKFIESGYIDFDKFLEDSYSDNTCKDCEGKDPNCKYCNGTGKIAEDAAGSDGIVSTDFPPNQRPEHMLGHAVKLPPDKENDEEDNMKKEEVNSNYVSISHYIKTLQNNNIDPEKIKNLIISRFNLTNFEADKQLSKFLSN